MAEGIVFKTNLPQFKAQLKAFGQDFERRTMRSATAAAATVFRKLVVANAPVRTGLLKRAVYIKRSRDRTSGREHYFVGVRQGRKAQRRKGGSLDAFYWRFVEQGHLARGPRSRLQGGKRRRALQRERLNASGAKRVGARPFLRPSFEQGREAAVQAFYGRVQKRLDQENRKQTKR
jgi:HK97 gp10 family phage protein